jgi:hypothetical protein
MNEAAGAADATAWAGTNNQNHFHLRDALLYDAAS